MNCQIVLDALSNYLDGSLLTNEAQLIERHLGQCSHCHLVRMELVEIRQAARELPLHTPSRALWRRIQVSIEAETMAFGQSPEVRKPPSWWAQLMERRFTFTLPQLAGVGALTIALLTFAFVNAFHQNTRMPSSPLAPASTFVSLPGEDELKHSIDQRMNVLKARQAAWDPQMLEIFQRNLIKIDDSLKNCRQSWLNHPEDKDHQQMVLTLYREKLQLLEDYDRLK